MGTTGTNIEKGTGLADFFSEELGIRPGSEFGEYLATSCAGGNFYAAVREPDGTVAGLVVAVSRSSGYWNIYYKAMHERCGPGLYDCPAKVLDLLSPTDEKYALEWRAACRKQVARVARSKTITPGTKLRFPQAFSFRDGSEESEFTFVEKNTFRFLWGGRCRIPGWQSMAYEVVS